MPLKVVRRKSTGALTIAGTVAGQRIQRRAQSDRLALAEEEAAALEIEILRSEWHGERRGSHTLTAAIIAYCEAKQRSEDTKARLRRIREALGDATTLREIDQGNDSLTWVGRCCEPVPAMPRCCAVSSSPCARSCITWLAVVGAIRRGSRRRSARKGAPCSCCLMKPSG